MADTGSSPSPGASARQAGPQGGHPAGRHHLAMILALVTVMVAAAAAALAVLVSRDGQRSAAAQTLRPSGIPPAISTSLAALMSLSPVPQARAPAFTLTDQNGRTVSLRGFRGRAIVLEFMDSHCVTICPLVSEEFADAYRDLGSLAGNVVFAAINVNPYHSAVSDVALFSREHHLTVIPSWHFLTGPIPRLRTACRDYQVTVEARGPDEDIIHTSTVYFIDPQGRERYIASPMAGYTKDGGAYLPPVELADWGRGIALVAHQLAG